MNPILLPGLISAVIVVGWGLYKAAKLYPVFMAAYFTFFIIMIPTVIGRIR